MKKAIIIIISFISLINFTFAQDYPGGYNPAEEESEGGKGKKISPYFFLDLKLAKLTDIYGTELGGGVGVLFNRSFGLSGEYFTLMSNNARVQINDTITNALSMGYGGISLSYSLFPIDILKLTAGSLFGLGRLTNSVQNTIGVGNYSEDDWFFLAEPRIQSGIRIFKSLWLGFSMGYRFSFGVNYYNLQNENISGPTFSIGIFSL